MTSILWRFFTVFLASTLCVYGQSFASTQNSNPLTVEQVQKLYPRAKVQKVSPEEYQELEKLYAQNSTPIKTLQPQTAPIDPCAAYRPAPPKEEVFDPYQPAPVRSGGNVGFNFGRNLDEAVLVLIAVIGAVVVAGMVIYAIGYVPTMASNNWQCRSWVELGYRFSYLTNGGTKNERLGSLNGLYFSLAYPSPIAVLGLTVEAGYHALGLDVTTKLPGGPLIDTYYGAYLMAGPSFTFPLESWGNIGNSFQLEWIAGTSSLASIGLMSTMRFAYLMHVSDSFSLQLGIGAALIRPKADKGYFSSDEQLSVLSGISTGYRF